MKKQILIGAGIGLSFLLGIIANEYKNELEDRGAANFALAFHAIQEGLAHDEIRVHCPSGPERTVSKAGIAVRLIPIVPYHGEASTAFRYARLNHLAITHIINAFLT